MTHQTHGLGVQERRLTLAPHVVNGLLRGVPDAREVLAVAGEVADTGSLPHHLRDVVVGCSYRDADPVVLAREQDRTWLLVHHGRAGAVQACLRGRVVHRRVTEAAVDDRVIGDSARWFDALPLEPLERHGEPKGLR